MAESRRPARDDAVDLLARRALCEARAAARLRHPGIVEVHDVVTDDGRLWIVMELVRDLHHGPEQLPLHDRLTSRVLEPRHVQPGLFAWVRVSQARK